MKTIITAARSTTSKHHEQTVINANACFFYNEISRFWLSWKQEMKCAPGNGAMKACCCHDKPNHETG